VTLRSAIRVGLGVIYGAAGVLHLAAPHPFVGIVPSFVPAPALVVAATGVAELAGAAALLQPWSLRLRHAAGWSFAAYALCVWPANINHMLIDLAKPDRGLGLGYHVPRMFLQPVLIWLAPWAAGAIDWPWRKRATRSG
jgi:uncharacterized membrane protein